MRKVILLMDFFEEFSKQLLKGIMQYAKEKDGWVFCRMPLHFREKKGVEGIVEWAEDWGADGIIGLLYQDENIKLFKERGIAVIAQDFKEPFTEIPNITGSYLETGYFAADYFLAKGFENFAFYGFKNIVWSRERARGFEERLAEHGHTVNFFGHSKANSQELWYYKPKKLQQWINGLPKPVAIWCCDDNQALHITEVCQQSEIRIPEQVAVLGVDDDELICDLSDPPLSSIKLDAVKGGYEAAKMLDEIISGESEGHDVFVRPS